jgi:cytochrome d ubiquinol oxidase subunit II
MTTAAAVILFSGVIAYSIFAGADFGAGFWDLVAGGTDRGSRPRDVIDRSIGPVWEANHVWLILCFVVLWTAFPEAYASITLTLFIPLTLAAFGILVRGASFAFRKAVFTTRERRRFGAVFALSSLIVPYCLGAIAGAIATGRVPSGGVAGDPIDSWINPTSILGGLLAIAAVAFLAATYLVWDAERFGEPDLTQYFRRRALIAAGMTGLIAFIAIFVLRADARYLFDGLTSRALPLVIASAVLGTGAVALLVRTNHRGARAAAIGAVISVLAAWGIAQWDYILPETLTITDAAAPTGTLQALLAGTALLGLLVLPAFGLLYHLDQADLLPEEGAEDAGATTLLDGPSD